MADLWMVHREEYTFSQNQLGREYAKKIADVWRGEGLTKGFCWWDENGERHDEDGFTMPEMKLFKGDVEEFFNGSERSAGWVSYQE